MPVLNDNSAIQYSNQQDYGYRRGFVLGLTLAETALLLIFILLMLLVIGFNKRDRTIIALTKIDNVVSSYVPAGIDRVKFIEEQLSLIDKLKNAALQAGQEWDENFIELVRTVATAANSAELADITQALEEKSAKLERMIQLTEEIQGLDDLEQLTEHIAELESANQNQRGQIAELRDRLGKVGLSNILPSCLTTPEGRIVFILDVALVSDGIRVLETIPEQRLQERNRLPLPSMDSSRIYSQLEFISATRNLFDWSVVNECRFYVSIYDGTASYEKDLYKELMKTVEGHFYKRQLNDAIPF